MYQLYFIKTICVLNLIRTHIVFYELFHSCYVCVADLLHKYKSFYITDFFL